MTGCRTCGGGMGKHDEAAHGDWPQTDECNGMCVMGNEVMPGQPAHQGHDDDPRGGYYDWAAYPHPDCPRHGDSASDAPPRFPDHCTDHADDPVPPKCGGCQKQKQHNQATARPLTLVSPMRRCLVHDQSFTTVCAGCRSEEIAAEETA